MSAGPLRQVVAVVGLVGLVPVLLQLAAGAITPEDAAMRGIAVAVAVLLLGYVARVVLTSLLRRMERRTAEEAEAVASDSPASPGEGPSGAAG